MKYIIFGVTLVIGVILVSQFMYVLPIHIGAFFVTILMVIVADIYGLAWLLGKVKTIPEKVLSRLHKIVGAGLIVSLTSGILMAWPVKDYLVTSPGFVTKMMFVCALIINSFFIHNHVSVASIGPFSDLPRRKQLVLIISGAVSGISWLGAFIAAQYIGL